MPHICEAYERMHRNACRYEKSRTAELLYLQHSPDPIRMRLPRVCSGEKSKNANTGQFHICRSIRQDVGRNYDADVIRINSQSGKGGVGYILEQNFRTESAGQDARGNGLCSKRQLSTTISTKSCMPSGDLRAVQEQIRGYYHAVQYYRGTLQTA